ncbi:uncharacterized protein LOC115745219 isoform X2 [Rhodamnia argentea]|uniref:Uncharacterized protein LOC115745219 isoform X2 n=1 Tax=Rhodamnia argentea TaxID=178133 RepID=A0A8B8PPS7_9MYRT|nr:uncharacterized protein LOC115745219 isoform X2 [Rhodamnia argentea]
MASAIGWYGPLIDLSKASSHVGDFVQLLVFVHRSTPVQYKVSKGGEIVRTDIQVGDDTRPRFTVSLWQKQMGSLAISGDVILLQNVKVARFGDLIDARTVSCSSIVPLVHSYELMVSEDELIGNSRLGTAAKEKLKKVIGWVKANELIIRNKQLSRNWKVLEVGEHKDCTSISEVLNLTCSCKAIFLASVGEIFLPIVWRATCEIEKEKMFISWRINSKDDGGLAEDFICTGCQLCGSPLELDRSKHALKQNSVPLYCDKSSNRLHVVSLIYQPFMLYLYDESGSLPLLVKNKAAELLFGNIPAERVYLCLEANLPVHKSSSKDVPETHYHAGGPQHGAPAEGASDIVSPSGDEMDREEKNKCHGSVDFHFVWFVMLKMLLQQGKNSPLGFEVNVDPRLDRESGRYEMVTATMPCFRNK